MILFEVLERLVAVDLLLSQGEVLQKLPDPVLLQFERRINTAEVGA